MLMFMNYFLFQSAMSRLNRGGDAAYQQVKDFPLNPKALSLGELYGEFDLNTNEWTDGVMSCVMRQTCAGKWQLFHKLRFVILHGDSH